MTSPLNCSTFFTKYLLSPMSEELSPREKVICCIFSAAIAFLTCGFLHIGAYLYLESFKEKIHSHQQEKEKGESKIAIVSDHQNQKGSENKPNNFNNSLGNQGNITDFTIEPSQGAGLYDDGKMRKIEDEVHKENILTTQEVKGNLERIINYYNSRIYRKDGFSVTDKGEDIQELENSVNDAFTKSTNIEDFSFIDSTGGNVLHYIAKYGMPLSSVAVLANNGIDFYKKDDSFGNTPLIWAVANANNSMASEIIQHAPVESLDVQCNDENTALLLAAAKGYRSQSKSKNNNTLSVSNLQLMEEMLKKGANPNLKNKMGLSPFHIACLRKDYAMIDLLLRHGANPDSLHLKLVCNEQLNNKELELHELNNCLDPEKILQLNEGQVNAVLIKVTPKNTFMLFTEEWTEENTKKCLLCIEKASKTPK